MMAASVIELQFRFFLVIPLVLRFMLNSALAREMQSVVSGRVDGVDDRQASVVVWWCRLPTACGAEAVAECKVESFASGEREAVVSREG